MDVVGIEIMRVRGLVRYSTCGYGSLLAAAARVAGAQEGLPRGFARGQARGKVFLLISCLIRLIHLLSLYREV